jgi:hypothetical protein
MNEIMDRIATGEYGAYKRHVHAKYWLGAGLALAVYTAIAAPFDGEAKADDFASMLPFYAPVIVGFFLSPFAREAFFWNPEEAKYDEFERNALNNAQSQSYWYILLLALALSLWQWLGTSFDFTKPTRPYDWSAIFMALIVIGIALPTFIAECLIPIPPGDGGDEA